MRLLNRLEREIDECQGEDLRYPGTGQQQEPIGPSNNHSSASLSENPHLVRTKEEKGDHEQLR